MKRFLLTAAVAASAISMCAQTNFVANGDFEKTEGVEQNTPWDWDDTKHNLKALPDWTINGLDDLCVLAMLVEPEVDDEYVFEGGSNKQCLHLYRFDDNGWQAGGIEQIVSGLTPGETYSLGAIIALSKGTTVDWDDPYFRIELMPLDANKEEFGADNIIDDKDDALAEADYWCPYEKEFKAPDSGNVRLRITHNNKKWDGNHSEGFWMDIDDIAIMTPADYAEYVANKSASISSIAVDAEAKTLGVYDLRGVRVADSMENLGDSKGFFIVRTTNGSQKVIR